MKLGNQSMKVSDQQKLVTVLDPEAGMWRCLLRDKDKVLLESQVEGEQGSRFHGLTLSPCVLDYGTLPVALESVGYGYGAGTQG